MRLNLKTRLLLLSGSLVSIGLMSAQYLEAKGSGFKILEVYGESNVVKRQVLRPNSWVNTKARSSVFGLIESIGVQTHQFPNTLMTFDSESVCTSGGHKVKISISFGIIDFKVPRLRDSCSTLNVWTDKGVTFIHGTQFAVSLNPRWMSVGTTRGSVTVGALAPSQTVRVNAGLYTMVQKGKPPLSPRVADRELQLSIVSQTPIVLSVQEGNAIYRDSRFLGSKVSSFVGDELEVVNPLAESKGWKVIRGTLDSRL